MALTRISSAGIQTSPTFSGVSTFTGNVSFGSSALFGNNDKIILGDGKRFEIYDNGTSAIIDNSYGGGSILRLGSGNQVVLGSPLSNNQTLIRGVVNGPSELYHAGTKRFETLSTGAKVTGNLDVTGVITYDDVTNVDSVGVITARSGINITGGNITLGDSGGSSDDRIKLGGSGDLQLYHDGSHGYLSNSTGTTKIGQGGTHVELYYGSVKVFHTHADNGGSVGLFRNLTAATNTKIMLGASANFQFFHDGTYSRINSENDGIIVRTNMFHINNGANNESLFKATNGLGVELYYNDVKRLETVDAGSKVTGQLEVTGITTISKSFRVNGVDANTDGVMPFVVRHGGYQGIQTSLFTTTLNNYPELVLQNEWGGNWNTTGPWKLKWTSPNEGDAGPAGDGRVLSELMPAIGNAGNLNGFRLRATDGSTGLKNVFLLHPSDSRFYINNSSGQTEAFRISAAGIGITNYIYHAGNIPNDTNTRFGFGGNDAIDFETNGTQRLLINNSGATVTGDLSIDDTIVHTGDTNTKIRFPDNDEISFETGGTQRLKIHSDGKMSFGHDNPSAYYDFEGPSTSSSLHLADFVNPGQNTLELNMYGGSTDLIQFAAINAEQNISIVTENANSVSATTSKGIYIKSGGNVGVNNVNPAFKLDVDGTFNVTGDVSIADKIVHTGDTNTFMSFPAADQIVFEGGGHERFRINGTTGKYLFGRDITGRAANYNNTSVVPTIQIEDDTEASFSVAKFSNNTDSSRIYLQKGRGSTGSAAAVQDSDTLGMIVFNGYNGSGFRNAAQITAEVDGDPATGNLSTDMPGALVFKTSADQTNVPAERLRITSTGRVGIGTTNPIAQLDVNVGSSVTAFNIEGSEGQLFSVTNNLSSGSIFAVNDITGLPSVDVNADGTIQLAPRGAGELVGIGTTSPTSKLHLVGDALITGVSTFSDNIILPDDKKIQLGDNQDLEILHDPSNGIIRSINSGGNMHVESKNHIELNVNYNPSSGSKENALKAIANNGVSLYFNNNQKFATTDTGACVYGDLSVCGTVDGTGAIGSKLFQQDNYRNLIAGTNAGLAITDTFSPPALSNILIGCEAGKKIRSQCYTVAIGVNAGRCVAAGSGQDTYVGSNSAQRTGCCGGTGSGNAFFGYGSGICGYNHTSNTLLGYHAGKGNNDSTGGTGGSCNVMVGYHAGSNYRAGSNNVLIGRYVGTSNSTASNNIAMGNHALYYNLTGSGNISFGSQSMEKNITGYLNVGISCNALFNNTTGNFNIAIGHNSLYCNTTHSNSIAIGCLAGYKATCGPNIMIGGGAGCNLNGCTNVMMGIGAGTQSREATGNTFVGHSAGACNYIGNNNTNIGCKAGIGYTTGCANISVGYHAGANTCGATGSGNLSMGHLSGKCISSAQCNISIGECAACCLSTGGCNVAIGKCAGKGYASGSENVSIGRESGAQGGNSSGSGNVTIGKAGSCITSGSGNIAIGCAANMSTGNVQGDANISMGPYTGRRLTTGGHNTFISGSAGRYTTTGSRNVFIGIFAGYCNVSGGCNVAIGCNAGRGSAAAFDNISMGRAALYSNEIGGGNVAIGHSSSYGLRGSNNVSIGATSGPANSCSDTHDNVFIGSRTGTAYTSGCNIIAIGINAGASSCCAATGCNNIHIGQNTGCKTQSGDNNITIGCRAGRNLTTGRCNIFLGLYAGGTVSTVSNVLAIGNRAAQNAAGSVIAIGCCAAGNTGGGSAGGIFIGRCAGRYANASDSPNIVMGSNAGRSITCGLNIIIGSGAAYPATTACRNIALGGQAHQKLTTGDGNIALGTFALAGNTTGCCNIAIGDVSGAMNEGATGGCNVTISVGSGHSLTTGSDNIFVGRDAGYEVTSSPRNVIIGCGAGRCLRDGSGGNTFIGDQAGHYMGRCDCSTNTGNVFVGQGAGKSVVNSCHAIAIGYQAAHGVAGSKFFASHTINIGCRAGCKMGPGGHSIINIGRMAGVSNSGGTFNVNIGYQAGFNNLTGGNNFYGGYLAGFCNKTGGSNIAIGQNAFKCGTSGTTNIFMLNATGCNANGHSNIALGYIAFRCNSSGSHNIALGACAMRGCDTPANGTGCCNIFIGRASGCYISAGNRNTVIGATAGYAITTGSKNVILGIDAGFNITSGSCNVVIGPSANVPSGCSGTMTIACGTTNWISGFNDGSVTINHGNANANGLLRISRSGAGTAQLRFDTASANTASLDISNSDGNELRVRYGSTEHTRFASSGSVGIGTASPRTKLHVEGSVHASRFFQNPTALDTTVTFPESGTAVNGGVYGPYTINTGVTLTISDGSTFTVV